MPPGEETEEDFKARVLAYFSAFGVGTAQWRFERLVHLRIGRQRVEVDRSDAPVILRGRYDLLLVNDQGANVMLAELKRPGEPLTVDDRDQAISYARLQDQMPPLVMLSNGDETRLYDVVSRQSVIGEQLKSRWTTVASGRVSVTADDLRLREEALQFFIGYSQGNVKAFCVAQQERRMAALRGEPGNRTKKYIPSVYVPRQAVRSEFNTFLGSSSPAFVLMGPSGVGKTNEICALATEMTAVHLSLFFNGSELAEGPARVLADEFNWAFGDQLSLPKICERLKSLLGSGERRALVFIDAVDECSVSLVERLLSDLVFQFDRFDGGLKLVVSLKNTQWDRFARFGDAASPLARLCYRRPGATGPIDEVRPSLPSIELGYWTSTDLDIAIRKYQSYFAIRGAITAQQGEIMKDPFVLRVLSEVCADGANEAWSLMHDHVPLTRRYLDQKLGKMPASERVAVSTALEALGGALLEAANAAESIEVHSVYEWKALERAPARGWLELPSEAFDAGLLVREYDDMGRPRIGFQYDRVRDYVIVYRVLRLDTLPPNEFALHLDAMLGNAVGRAALLAYLEASPSTSHEAPLRKRAHQCAERFLAAYDRIRCGLGDLLRSRVSPKTQHSIGLVYSFHGHAGWVYGFFVRHQEEESVIVRPNYGVEWRAVWRTGGSADVPCSDGVLSSTAWPLLVDPERLAAERALEELRKAVGHGGLDETVSTTLEIEKVFAISGRHRKDLEFGNAALVPMDLEVLRRRVHGALGASQAHFSVISKHRQGNASESWTAMKEARQAAAAGKRFYHPDNVIPIPPLQVLAEVLDRLVPSMPTLDRYYLPLPDIEGPASTGAESHFEDGYSDSQLAAFIAQLWVLQLDEYMRVVDANLPSVRHRLSRYATLPQHLIVLFRRPRGPDAMGLGGALGYARLKVDAPFPVRPDAVTAVGRGAKVQVYPWSEEFRFESDDDGSLRLSILQGPSIQLSNGWSESEISRLLVSVIQVPLCFNGSRSHEFMPVRNAVYEFLAEDLTKLDAETLRDESARG